MNRPDGFTGTPEQAAHAAQLAAKLHAKRGTSSPDQIAQWEALALYALAHGAGAPLPPNAQRHAERLEPGTPQQRRTQAARRARAANRAQRDAGKRMAINLPPDAADVVRDFSAKSGLDYTEAVRKLIVEGSSAARAWA